MTRPDADERSALSLFFALVLIRHGRRVTMRSPWTAGPLPGSSDAGASASQAPRCLLDRHAGLYALKIAASIARRPGAVAAQATKAAKP